MRKTSVSSCLMILFFSTAALQAQLVISGNEGKISLVTGKPALQSPAEPDSISLIEFSTFPPSVRHLSGIANSVIGPPSNIAISPDEKRALIANSLCVDKSAQPDPWRPEYQVHVLDLTLSPPQITATVMTDAQPSGMSISADGTFAIVANRAAGTVTQIFLKGDSPTSSEPIKVCEPEESISDVAISPNGKIALASIQKGGYLSILRIENGKVVATDQKLSVYGEPYRVVITPDGKLGLTAGQGAAANGVDNDALSIVDLTAQPILTVDHVSIGPVPESIEVSPDGNLVAAVLMSGSNLPNDNPAFSDEGELVLLARRGNTYRVVEKHQIGRIPEGVAFTGDGRYLLVQCHPDKNIWVFRVHGERVKDSGHRIDVPGFPSSLRAAL